MIMLVMGWESSVSSAALAMPTIPEESIRIRILANSDSVEDQWVKREVQRAIAAEIGGWPLSGGSLEQARAQIAERMPELERIIHRILVQYSFAYGYGIEFGQVRFPSKVYGKDVYPAGDYEALLITLGEGKGENWWCVLFPPLCLGAETVKAKSDEASAAEEADADPDAAASADEQQDAQRGEAAAGKRDAMTAEVGADKVEVRFFFADAGKKAGEWMKGLIDR